jgi:hypothetical protein
MEYIEEIEDRLAISERKSEHVLPQNEVDVRLREKFGGK